MVSSSVRRKYSTFCSLVGSDTSSPSPKVNESQKFKSLLWVDNFVEDVFDEYFLSLPKDSFVYDLKAFPHFVYAYICKEFASEFPSNEFHPRVKQICFDLLDVIGKVRTTSIGVNIFSNFLSEHYTLNEFVFFLLLRSSTEKIKLIQGAGTIMIHEMLLDKGEIMEILRDAEESEELIAGIVKRIIALGKSKLPALQFLQISLEWFHDLHASKKQPYVDVDQTQSAKNRSHYQRESSKSLIQQSHREPGFTERATKSASDHQIKKPQRTTPLFEKPLKVRIDSNPVVADAEESPISSHTTSRKHHDNDYGKDVKKVDPYYERYLESLRNKPKIETYTPQRREYTSEPISFDPSKYVLKTPETKQKEYFSSPESPIYKEHSQVDREFFSADYHKNEHESLSPMKYEEKTREIMKNPSFDSDVGSLVSKSSSDISMDLVKALNEAVQEEIHSSVVAIMNRSSITSLDLPFDVHNALEKEIESKITEKLNRIVKFTAGIQRGRIHFHEYICSKKALPETCFQNDLRKRFRVIVRLAFERREVDFHVKNKMKEYLRHISNSYEMKREVEPLLGLLLSYASSKLVY